MSRRDLHCASTKGHVHNDPIGDDGQATINKWMLGEFAMEMLWRCQRVIIYVQLDRPCIEDRPGAQQLQYHLALFQGVW